jgi:hypothetical protein
MKDETAERIIGGIIGAALAVVLLVTYKSVVRAINWEALAEDERTLSQTGPYIAQQDRELAALRAENRRLRRLQPIVGIYEQKPTDCAPDAWITFKNFEAEQSQELVSISGERCVEFDDLTIDGATLPHLFLTIGTQPGPGKPQ